LRAILARELAVTIPVSAITALLPVVSRSEMGLDAVGFGLLLGCFGVGGVLSMLVIPRLRSRFSADGRLRISCTILAMTTLALALSRDLRILSVALIIGGGGWLLTWSTFQVAAQRSLPAWVRARGMALYFLVFQGGVAVGSATWGVIAERTNTEVSLLIAALALMASAGLVRWWPLGRTEMIDHGPALDPASAWISLPSDQPGPVLVRVTYTVRPEEHASFLEAIRRVGEMRGRLGAFGWGVYRDPTERDRFVETYHIDSRIEYLRQRDRVTVNDRLVEDAVSELLVGRDKPPVSYFVSAVG
jgi:MFS family permease